MKIIKITGNKNAAGKARIFRVCATLLLSGLLLFSGGCGRDAGKDPTGIKTEEDGPEAEADKAAPVPGGEQEMLLAGAEREMAEPETEAEVPPPEAEDESPAPAPEAEAEILRFVDVFGEEYETKIDPGIPKHSYDLSLFKREGQALTYEDEGHTSSLGVDVSHHQGKIDWNRVAGQGFSFAILRIGYRGYGTEGKLGEDREFRENLKGAKAAGLRVGVYFFAQAVNEEEAREEAAFVLNLLDGEELDLPVVYDPETILDAPARTDDVSPEQFTANTAVFCEAVREAGYEPMIYANMLWEAFELDLKRLESIPVWYADYEPLPQTPYAFKMWQYSNEGQVNGIAGACDLDILIENPA